MVLTHVGCCREQALRRRHAQLRLNSRAQTSRAARPLSRLADGPPWPGPRPLRLQPFGSLLGLSTAGAGRPGMSMADHSDIRKARANIGMWKIFLLPDGSSFESLIRHVYSSFGEKVETMCYNTSP